MLQVQKKFIEYIREVNRIIKPLDVSNNGVDNIQTSIEQAELIVPVVGGFSAGKSTLINSFLGTDILPTAVTPETALATELRYSTEERIEAVANHGGIERYGLSEFATVKDNAKNYKNLRVYLNNENLKVIQPLVLVDMPGFDAPIESHNQAILTYLSRGVYFVFLTSVEDGNITLSMKREIENIQQFGKGFSFCISKTNLRSPDDVELVKNKISEQLDEDFDYQDQIALLDMNGGGNLKNILQAINPEELFYSLFIEDLRENYTSITQSINVKIATFENGKQSADDTIQALQSAIDKLEAQKERALEESASRYSSHKITTISEKVAQILLARKTHLIELAVQNSQNPAVFTAELNDLVKNTLLSEVQSSFQDISGSILQDFSAAVKGEFVHRNKLVISDDMINSIQEGTAKLLNQAAAGLGRLATEMSDRAKSSGNIHNVYRAIATIVGLTTAVVAPVIEIVIIFLPDIIKFLTQGAQERRLREQIEQQIVHTMIPEIKVKIRESLPGIYNEQVEMLIKQISEQFDTQLKQKQAEIEAANAEKEAKSGALQQEIDKLQQGKQELASLANQYLFA
ncbi:dynamin family protein [Moraxella sp. FZLJ2107]|uniref:dynamin family protein n=1 Tax=unclassified Moraxella TaxID=2685852 RepID=UPI0020C93345|nr:MULTISPECIES: dynamin family protein [unclassified Moraxella]UTO04976.1 dynamin family protein [Moraxella sp. FZLJ2107]UTO21710.1 dynamin family protein [Moraxella sp. FZLJ2109]